MPSFSGNVYMCLKALISDKFPLLIFAYLLNPRVKIGEKYLKCSKLIYTSDMT